MEFRATLMDVDVGKENLDDNKSWSANLQNHFDALLRVHCTLKVFFTTLRYLEKVLILLKSYWALKKIYFLEMQSLICHQF